MARELQATKRFNIKAERIYEYVTENWGARAGDNFMIKLDGKFEQIRKHPEIGRPSSKKPNIRRLRIGKQNILYYSNKRSKTWITNMFSVYGDPDRNPYG